MQHLRQKGPLSLLAATLTKNRGGGGVRAQVPGKIMRVGSHHKSRARRRNSRLKRCQSRVSNFEFRLSAWCFPAALTSQDRGRTLASETAATPRNVPPHIANRGRPDRDEIREGCPATAANHETLLRRR